jgi:hypothetical protein
MDEPQDKKQAKARAYQLFKTLFAAEPGRVFTETHTLNGKVYHGFDDEIGLQMLQAEPDLLVEKAKINVTYFDMLSKAFAHSLTNDLDIPQSVKTLMADYILNPKIKPHKKSGRPRNNDFNKTLRLALNELKSAGIPPSRNDAFSSRAIPNGTDIIMKILKDLGHEGEHHQTNLQRRYYREMKRFNSKANR